MDKISLIHGEGGRKSQELIQEVIKKYLDNPYLRQDMDAAILDIEGKIAFTTDSYVVKPLFFRGGDIGKLAVCGTVNDLLTVFSRPLYLSCSFIIEDGFLMKDFIKILQSMKTTCETANVKIVTGDTKVVSKGEADGIYINTSGIGVRYADINCDIKPHDKIIVSGSIGLHGTMILIDRYKLNVDTSLISDCAPLTYLLDVMKKYQKEIKIMRDVTRGGIATILNEVSTLSSVDIEVIENDIPIHPEVSAINEMLGIDPLYLSCEGRMLFVVSDAIANDIIDDLKRLNHCADAKVIGEVIQPSKDPKVYIKTDIGGKRILGTLDDLILPRIC